MKPNGAGRLPAIAACVVLLGHLIGNPHYGFFRDELYFIICGRHPALGYVDQPPLIPLLAAGSQLFGRSLVILRAVPAVFAAASVYVTCALVREMGAGRFGQLLAALACALCPVLCGFGMKLSPDTFGLWSWPLLALWLLQLSRGADRRRWIHVGLLLGLSALAKYTAIHFAFALLLAILCTRTRRMLATRGFAIALAIACALVLPNFVWQAVHGFPMLELLRNAQHGKNVALSPAGYLASQLLITSPFLSWIWIAGLIRLLADRATRFLGLGFLFLLAIMAASHAKHYYPADVYPILFAAGGAAIEHARVRAVRGIAIGSALASLVLIPYVLPILPEPLFVRYHARLGPILHLEAARTENSPASVLPQDYADMHGWPEIADAVQRVVDGLAPQDRARVTIVASNYGEAAAIDFFGRDLPPVLSGHNQYFLWGTRGRDGDLLIDVGGDCGAAEHLFRASERAAVVTSPYAMKWESPLSIMVCRGITRPLAELWPAKKFYY